MAVLLVFQNHCGTGVQRAENPDGNEWQALWWTHELVQSRKAKVLSLFPSSHWWMCPGCNCGCCSAPVGLWWSCLLLGVPWVRQCLGEGQEGPSSPPAWAGQGMCSLLAGEMALSCCWLCCLRCLKGMQLESFSQLSRSSAYPTDLLSSMQGGREAGHRGPWPAETTPKPPCGSSVPPPQRFSVPSFVCMW